MMGGASLEALETLYRERFHRFLRLAEGFCGDLELARDVVQEAFASAIRSRHTFRGEATIEVWVWQMVVNGARKAARARVSALVSDEELQRLQARNGRAPDAELRGLVAALPERQRLALFLRYYADLDYEAIARVLEIAPGTVGATLSAAHASIRRALTEVAR